MEEDLDEMLEAMGLDGWESGGFGDTLICPHGNEIELDGRCPYGCVSPLLTAGLI